MNIKGINDVKEMKELLSYIGGTILCVNIWPQIYKTWKIKSAKELSYMFIMLNGIGLTLMGTYGIVIKDKSIYIPISMSLLNTIILMMLKIKMDTNEISDFLGNGH